MARKTQTRRSRSTRRNGGGYGTPGVYFNPDAQHPSSNAAAPSSDPVTGWVRPPMAATEVVSPDALTTSQLGGRRQTRRMNKMRGGFSPALMGSFVANAQTAIVPLALYGLYYMFAQKGTAVANTRRNTRNNRNRSSRNRV